MQALKQPKKEKALEVKIDCSEPVPHDCLKPVRVLTAISGKDSYRKNKKGFHE